MMKEFISALTWMVRVIKWECALQVIKLTDAQ